MPILRKSRKNPPCLSDPSCPAAATGGGGGGFAGVFAKLSPSRGGALPVQTGFPTSLIDLVVKNRDRLKKSKKKKPPESPEPSPIALSGVGDADDAEAGPASPRAYVLPESPRADAIRDGAFRLGTDFLTLGLLLSLALVTVWSKGLVLGVTLAAVVLLLVELSLARARRRRGAATPDSDTESTGRVSLIIGEFEDAGSDHTARSSSVSIESDARSAVSVAYSNVSPPPPTLPESNKWNWKGKKFLKNLFGHKPRSAAPQDDAPPSTPPPPPRSRCQGPPTSRAIMSRTAAAAGTERGRGRLRALRLLVLVAVVLLGLAMGGKAGAILLTVSCCWLIAPVESVAKDRNLQRDRWISCS